MRGSRVNVTVAGRLRITFASLPGIISTIPPGGTRTPDTFTTFPFAEKSSGP